jgi:hypothetical protein
MYANKNTIYIFISSSFKDIPMEILDPNQPNQIRILYYITPSRFYVYLREKLNSHTSVNKFFNTFKSKLYVHLLLVSN